MGLPYRNVKDIYDTLHGAGVVSSSLPEWSTEMNALSQSDLYSQGLNDNFIKRGSVGIDRLLEATGLPNVTGEFGAGVGSLVGNEQAGREIGRGLPRMAVNFAPLVAGPWGLAATGALSGAETYTNTGSPAAGIVSGATNVLMPGVANLAERGVLRGLGAKYLSGPIIDKLGNVTQVDRYFPTGGQKVASFLGGQATAAGFGELSSGLQAGLDPNREYHFSPSEAALNLTLGQLPFAAAHLAGKVVGREKSAPSYNDVDALIKSSQVRIEEKRIFDEENQKSPIERQPNVEQISMPVQEAEISMRLAKIRGEKEALLTSGDPEAGRKLADLDVQELSAMEESQGTGVLGESITPQAARVNVVGTEHFHNPKTGYRIIKVGDNPENVANGFTPGDLVGYSTKGEPTVLSENGQSQFGVPTRYHTKGIKDNRVVADAARLAENPDLPLQTNSGLDKAREFAADLSDVKAKLDAVADGDTEGFRQAIESYNGVLQKHGYEPLTDAKIAQHQAFVGAKNPSDAVRGLVNKAALRMAQKEAQLKAENALLAEKVKDPEILAMYQATEAGRAGSFVKALRRWVADGEPGGTEGLRTRALKAKEKGGDGAPKVAVPMAKKTEEAAKVVSPSTEHVRDLRRNVAEDVTQDVFDSADEADASQWREAFVDGSLDADPKLRGFASEPHVKEWTDAANAQLEKMGVHDPVRDLVPAQSRLPAGGGFVHDLVPYDEATNKLGKHTLPKTGTLAVSQFKNMGKDQGQLPEVVIELGKMLVPEAFGKNGETETVNVPALMKGLKEKGPVVETHEYGMEGKVSEAKAELDKMTHEWLDLFPTETQAAIIRSVRGNPFPRDAAALAGLEPAKLQQFQSLHTKVAAEPPDTSPRATSYYHQISPFDTEKYPVTRVDVVLPLKNKTSIWIQDNLHENLPNTLGWAMVQFVPHPVTGETVMFVGEQQSRWGQQVQKEAKSGKVPEGQDVIVDDRSPSYPLLPLQHTLILKAAIAEAQRRGVTKMIVSDGETAMMTEGHDKQKPAEPKGPVDGEAYRNKQTAQDSADHLTRVTGTIHDIFDEDPGSGGLWRVNSTGQVGEPSQAGGMRLHYDTTLQSAMRSLTGDKGEKVEVGTHKNAYEARRGGEPGNNEGGLVGSPVFRNPDGTPKSSVTGTTYDLTKAFAKSEAQGGFTLTDPSHAPGVARADAPKPFVPQTPEEIERLRQLAPDSGGAGLVAQLQRSSDPVTKALADILAKNFPDSLSRIFVRVMNMSQEGFAHSIGNREVEVQLSHGNLMSNDVVRREQVQMHELIHGLTIAELDNPTKRVQVEELEALRQRLIEKLPEPLQARLKELIATDWIGRYGRGEAQMTDLSSSEGMRQVMYGLMNIKELVTQGFTDKNMRTFMGVLRNPNGKVGFGVFVDWVKRFLGFDPKTSDSELAHFTDITSRIMSQGQYVSDVANFTDHWFAQKGYAPGLVREQSRKVLEVIQSTGILPSKELMLSTLATREPITKEFQDAQKGVTEMLAENGPEAQATASVLGELKHPLDSIDSLVTNHLTEPISDMRDAMDMLPPQVTRLMFERARDMKEVLEAVDAAATEKNEGLLNLVDPKELRGPVRESLKAINDFLKIEREHETAARQLRGMETVPPDAFFNRVLGEPSRSPQASPNKKGILESVGDFIGAYGGKSFSHFLQQPAQIARSNPVFGEWYSKALLLNAQIRNMAKASMEIFGRTIGKDGVVAEQTVQAELDKAYKALQSPQLRSALDQLIYLKQERGGNKVGPIDYSDPQVAKILQGLSEADRSNLINLDNKIRLSKVAADQQTLHSMQQVFATLAARVVMRDSGLKMEPAVDAANKTFDAVLQAQTNPQVSQALLASVQAKMQPDAFLNLLKFTQDSVEQHQTYAKYLADNSDWVSAQRNGSYIFEYEKGGKMVKASAENMKDAKQRSGGRDILNWRKNTREDGDAVFLGDNATEIITRLRQLEGNQMDMLRNVVSPEDVASLQKTSPVAQFERETNAMQRGTNLELKGRTLSKGAEELPWFENHIDWIQKNASYWQRRLLRSQGETMALEPGTAGTETGDMIRQHIDELMQKDPEVGRKVQQIASTWALGFNVATQIANSTQTYMRGVTELIGLGQGPIAALREISQAWSDYAGHKLGDKPYRTPDEERFLKGALHDGQIDASIFDDNAAANEAAATNFKRIINKERPKSVGEHVASAAGAYSTAGMWMFKHGERANNEVTLLAAFRALQKAKPGLSFEEKVKQAYLVNASVNDVGGRANRPLGLFSGKGDFARTVAMTASSLQSYLLGSTFQLIRNLKAGGFRPNGLTPSEVYAARKAAIYQLGVQFAAAGILGMPFVSGALALLNQAFPELELNKKVRESVSSLLNSDGENGHILSDIALSGVPSMMGWDFQSRLSAGNILPGVSEYNGFQPEQLLGVPASIVSRFVQGGKSLAGGDSQGAYAFVPPAFQKVAKLLTGDANRDYRGRPVLQPTPGEQIGQALGFSPTRLSQYNAADRMAEQSEHLAIVRTGQENQRLAGEALKGNFGTVRAALQNQIQSDKFYNPQDAVRAIARAAEEMTFQKDLRREGSQRDMDSRKQLLGSFQIDPSSASEVARLQFRRGIEQRLGLTTTSNREVQMAQLMDQLRAHDPNATRSALRVAAEQTLRRTQPSQLQLQ